MKRKVQVFLALTCAYVLYRGWLEIRGYGNKYAETRPLSHAECRQKILGPRVYLMADEDDSERYQEITCETLLYGNIEKDGVYALAKEYMSKAKQDYTKTEGYYAAYIQNIGCDKFKVIQGYHVTPINQEEAEFPIAFNILLHKDIIQFELLLRAIYRPQNSYCLHIDTKSSKELFSSVSAIVKCFDNVFIASKLERVVYAGYTRLQADINCMEDQLDSPIQWKYMLNIAGSEMPAKTNLEMVRILKIYNGANDIEGLYGDRVIRKRFEYKWIEDTETKSDYKMVKTDIKHPDPPYHLDILRGNSCGVFSRAFIEWVFANEVPRALLAWSNDTQSPDEQYWATLHHTFTNAHIDPPGSYAGEPDHKPWLAKYVSWEGASPCHGRLVHSICIFGVKDLPSLLKRPEFMFNKFASNIEPLTQECIGRWIEYKTECQTGFSTTYYEKLPFIIKPGK